MTNKPTTNNDRVPVEGITIAVAKDAAATPEPEPVDVVTHICGYKLPWRVSGSGVMRDSDGVAITIYSIAVARWIVDQANAQAVIQ